MNRRTALLVVAAVVALGAAGLSARVLLDHGGEAPNGTGLTFEGRFYWASGQQVKDSALGELIAQGVAFQDTTADLRRIEGLDPRTTLAALLPSLNGSPGGPRWTLVSTDENRGADPAAYDDTRVVLTPAAGGP